MADGGGIFHIFISLRGCLGAPCGGSLLLGVAGVSVGVVVPIARFGHDGFIVVADCFFCIELVL